MIDPGTALRGETVEDYCRRRWGGSGWTHSLKSSGKKDGALFADWKYWPNTLKAHQLIHFCSKNSICSTDEANKHLFEAEYEKGQNISSEECLVAIGKNLGANEEDLQKYLSQDQGADEVKKDINSGRRKYGISGVPYFIVGDSKESNKPYGFSGAQEPDTFVELFENLSG